jgi:hypothetical protein
MTKLIHATRQLPYARPHDLQHLLRHGAMPGLFKLAETLSIKSLSKSQVSELAKSLDVAVEQFRSRALDGGQLRGRTQQLAQLTHP